jgi:hypothetical protein
MNTPEHLPEVRNAEEKLEVDERMPKVVEHDCPGERVKLSVFVKQLNTVVQHGYRTKKKNQRNDNLTFNGKLRMSDEDNIESPIESHNAPDIEEVSGPPKDMSQRFNDEKMTFRSGNQTPAPTNLKGVEKLILKGTKDIPTMLHPRLRAGASLNARNGANAFNGWQRIGLPPKFKDYNFATYDNYSLG